MTAMTNKPNPFIAPIANALDLPGATNALPDIKITGADALPSFFAVTDLATASMGIASAMISRYRGLATGDQAGVIIDQRLASKWFDITIRPIGWELPPVWDAIAGDYKTADGWIRLHTNAPHHRAAAFRFWAIIRIARPSPPLSQTGNPMTSKPQSLRRAAVPPPCAASMTGNPTRRGGDCSRTADRLAGSRHIHQIAPRYPARPPLGRDSRA